MELWRRWIGWGARDREILALAVPALGALLAEPLYILADTAVVGHLGTPQLGGLSLASGVLLIALTVFVFLAYGTTSSVARLLGAGEERRAAHQAVQSLWLAVLLGVTIAGVLYAIRTPLIAALGGEGDVAVHANNYLRISLLGLPGMLVALAGVGYLRGLQDTKRPLYVALGTAALNLVLELVLIYGFRQGIGASALSTVIAQWIGAAAYIGWIARAVRRQGVGLTPDLSVIKSLAGAGLDLFHRNATMRLGLTTTLAVAARMGDDALAAHEIAFQVWTTLALFLDAVAIAAQAMIGNALGAGNVDDVRALSRRMMQWGWSTGAMAGVLMLAVSGVLPAVFTGDEAVRELAAVLLIYVAVFSPMNGAAFVLDGILIGAGDLRFLAVATAAASAVLTGGALLVGALGAGISWLWVSLGAWMAIRLVLLGLRFLGGAWIVTGADK
ncbi:MAG: MATE family efflux transporter [Planctomycetota bacterium]